MHFKNENDINSNTNQAQQATSTSTTTPTPTSSSSSTSSSSTSSADSGVVIIDNRTVFGNSSSNFAKNNANSNTNNNTLNNSNKNNKNNKSWSTSQSNGIIKNSNLSHSIGNDAISRNAATVPDKIENTTKVDNFSWNEKRNESSNYGNIKCTDHSCKSSNTAENEKCNVAGSRVNIEGVINISKGHDAGVDDPNVNQMKHRHCSPTISVRTSRSPSISISSIDENANDSSIIDSDSDREAEGVHSNYVVKKLGQQTTFPAGSPDVPMINKGLTVISQKISPNGVVVGDVLSGEFSAASIPGTLGAVPPTATSPQIGSIALTNSTDVTFGDKHFYEGPVTIQQILIDRKWKAGEENAHDNPTFDKDPGCDTFGAKKGDSPPPPNGTFGFIRRRKYIVLLSTIFVLAIFIGVIVSTTKFSKSSNVEDLDDDDLHAELQVVGRSDWLARPPKAEMDKLKLPVRRVIISHTATESCMEKDVCISRVRVIQDFHMDSMKWDDIGYNFLVGGDGRVYVGRGWDNQGAHTKGYNVDSIGISFIGTFTTIVPTKRQIMAAKLLIEEGVRRMKIAPDYCIFGARQLVAFESPGLALYNIIKTWPHWSENIKCIGGVDNIGGGLVLRIVARDAWLAQPPSKPLAPLELPVHSVIVMATNSDICTAQASCTHRVRFIQTYNIESLQNDDIIYNFLIGGDGNVYEGRGWDFQGAHMKGHNNATISFAYIGTFRRTSPNDKQMYVTKLLLEEGVRLGKLSWDFKIYPATKFDPTSSDTISATALYESFKAWPHWSKE